MFQCRLNSYRCADARLHGQVPTLPRHFTEDHPAVPTALPVPSASKARGAILVLHVDRTEDLSLASAHAQSSRIQ